MCFPRHLLLIAALALCGSALRAQAEPRSYTLRIYALQDLSFRMSTGGTVETFDRKKLSEAEMEELQRTRQREAEALEEMVRIYMEPKFDTTDPEQRIRIGEGHIALLLSATAEQHEWTAKFLESLRRSSLCFEVETHVLTVPESSLAELALGDAPSILGDAAATTAFLEKAKKLKQIDLLQAPKILSLNGQRATISTMSQTSYIKRYDEIDLIEPQRQRIIDPVIDVAKQGLEWKLRAVALPDRSIGLQSDLEVSELVRPIPQKETPYGKISVPEVRTKRVQSTVRLRPGQCLVLSSNPTDGKRLVLLLRATPVEMGDLDRAGKEPAAEPSERKR